MTEVSVFDKESCRHWVERAPNRTQLLHATELEGQEYPRSLDSRWLHHKLQLLDAKLQTLLFVLLGFCLASACSFFHFRRGDVYFVPLCFGNKWLDLFINHSFIYVLQGISDERILGVSEEILNHVDTVKTQGTIGDGLRAHGIMSSTWPWRPGLECFSLKLVCFDDKSVRSRHMIVIIYCQID